MAFTALNSQVTAPPAPIVPVASSTRHPVEIDGAFAGNHELRKRVHAAIEADPTQSTLFRDISIYMLSQPQPAQPPTEPAAKKRKLDPPSAGSLVASSATRPWRSYPAVSFAIPQRKKLTLELLDTCDGGVRAVGAHGSVEFSIAWKHVDHVFCLPIPEKAKKQHHFIVIPTHGDGVNPLPDHLNGAPPEPMVWTFEEASGKSMVEGEDPGPAPMAEAIHHCLIHAGTGKHVMFPHADDFSSAIPESHRRGEKAYHVKAHRGSKEGYLFFTAAGILYGFKKPLAYFDFASINSIAYAAVLRNTFNLVITTQTQEIEFAMLDQADYAGINDYVQRHGLQDASLAAARRAKKLNVNKSKDKSTDANGAAAAEEESELQKAERELQDAEDDEEDDYDPGSEGESEGSGSDSEDEDGGGGGGFNKGDADEGDEMEE